MSASDLAAALLLGIAVLSGVVTAIGMVAAKDAYERMHYMSPVATIGAWAIAAAVVVKESVNQAGIKAVLIAAIIFFMNAVLTHATARAARARQYGNLKIRPEEKRNRPEKR